jgi:hypothetical protein
MAAQVNLHRNGDLARGYLLTDPVEEAAGRKLLASQQTNPQRQAPKIARRHAEPAVRRPILQVGRLAQAFIGHGIQAGQPPGRRLSHTPHQHRLASRSGGRFDLPRAHLKEGFVLK